MTSRSVRIALYGDVDLNVLDGSAVWLASLAQALHLDERVTVTVVLKAPERRALLTGPLHVLPRVRLVDPRDHGHDRPLTRPQALALVAGLHGRERFDCLVLRGFALCEEATRRDDLPERVWSYLTDVPQRVADLTAERLAALDAVVEAATRLLCQTEELRAFLEAVLPRHASKMVLLPPIVPAQAWDGTGAEQNDAPRPRRLLYAGKFAPMWGFLEAVEAFSRLRAELPDLEFHVAGDKVHNPPDAPGYADAVRSALTGTEGLVWHGAMSRARVFELLRTVDVALSARHAGLDDSLELSTKVLEYGATGVPPVLNRTPMHERLLGADYPLFVDGLGDLTAVVGRALEHSETLAAARTRATRAAAPFAAERVLDRLRPELDAMAGGLPGATTGARPGTRPGLVRATTRGRPRVLVAGHDLKFFAPIGAALRDAGAVVERDVWSSHSGHDAARSRAALDGADVIVCEWCLGNASWYAANVRRGQRLVVRFHLQELDTPYPARLDLRRVDAVVFVSDHTRQEARRRFGWPTDRLHVLGNAVDVRALDRPKLPGAERTLGMLGYLPARKRLDLALDLLEALRPADDRFRLIVKGRRPWETAWLWDRSDERAFYARQFARVRSSPLLREAVTFEPFDPNVASWFRKVGFLVSPSDFESFHVAVAEGMASRAVPVIRVREGVADLFPGPWSHPDTVTAAASVVETVRTGGWSACGERARRQVANRYDVATVGRAWRGLLGV